MTKKHPNMTQVLKRFRRAIEQDINERALRMGEETSETIATLMVEYSRNLLRTRATPATQSTGLIDKIANSIHIEEASGETGEGRAVFSSAKNNKKRLKGKVFKVPVDKDRLVMFLEYGTGLEGKNNPHPEASNFGWAYAVNDGKIKKIIRGRQMNGKFERYTTYVNWYTQMFGDRGFVFKNKKGSYLDRADRLFRNEYEQITKKTSVTYFTPETLMHSKYGKPYIRPAYTATRRLPVSQWKEIITYKESKQQYAFSSGLKPIRFIYDTKKKGLPEILEQIREEIKK